MPEGAPAYARLMQATAIVLATTTAGLGAGLSLFVVPRMLDSPSPRAVTEQWAVTSARTRALFPLPMVVLPGLLNAALAYLVPGRARLYLAAAAATLGILPWTAIAVAPVEWKMERRARQVEAYGDSCGPLVEEITRSSTQETAHDVVRVWGSRNLYRCGVSFLAGCAGLYAALT